VPASAPNTVVTKWSSLAYRSRFSEDPSIAAIVLVDNSVAVANQQRLVALVTLYRYVPTIRICHHAASACQRGNGALGQTTIRLTITCSPFFQRTVNSAWCDPIM
jgi:hypothetical protein